jgi:hypothetical protein
MNKSTENDTRKGSRVTIISKRDRIIEFSVVQNVSKICYTETKIVPFYWECSYWDYRLRLPLYSCAIYHELVIKFYCGKMFFRLG